MAEDAEREHELAVDDSPVEKITVDPSTLTPTSPQVISRYHQSYLFGLCSQLIPRQATINIGTIGHVAHGKSTVVKAISGVHTIRFKNEIERNITIKLGYANAKATSPPLLLSTTDPSLSNLLGCRSTNAITLHVPVQAATNPFPPTRKTIRLVNAAIAAGK